MNPVALALAVVVSGCIFDERGGILREPHLGTGHAVFDLQLEQNQSVLAKSAADTTFQLDSLLIVLSAPNADTVIHRAAISGRPDTGKIALPPLAVELDALRNWKAIFYSIDERETPFRRDTVHIDSVVFGVFPSDTVVVNKTVSPAFSILRTRFLSHAADSVPDNVVYLRLRIDGVTRDSVAVGGKDASLNWLQALSGNVIYAAGDSGRFLRSTNDATSWQELQLPGGETRRVVSGAFWNHSVGYVVTDTGSFFRTADSGKSWQKRPADVGVGAPINALFFTSEATGYAVGAGGVVRKTTGGGWSWYNTHTNTSQNLNGVHFPTSNIGFVVGENETILRTTSGDNGDAPPPGGVVWQPVAGGWFPQTSNTTNQVNGVHFQTKDTGWAVGAGGLMRVTYNAGAVWNDRNSTVSGMQVNAVWFSNPSTGWIVGNSGQVRKFMTEWDWRLLNADNIGTTEDLYDVRSIGSDTAYMVGANGTLRRTINGTAAPHNIVWSGQVLPASMTPPSPDSAWTGKASGTTNALNAVHFANATTGWAVGAGGVIRKTTDSGNTWTSQTSAAQALNAVHAINANTVIAVGANGMMRRTTNGGTSWTTITSGLPSTTLNSVDFFSSTVGWVVGASNEIRSTNNGGTSWTSRNSGTGTYNAVSVGNSRVWIVGNGGQIRRSNNRNHNASFSTVSAPASIGTTNLNGAFFSLTSGVGWVVGDGGLIVKLEGNINHNNTNFITWTSQTSGTTENLRNVHFFNDNLGYVVGVSGTILKTTNGGDTWATLESGTSQTLHGVFAQTTSNAVVVGAGGSIRRTTTGGEDGDPDPDPNTNHLRSVHAVTPSLVYVAGDNGTIGKTTNAGGTWELQETPNTTHLHGIGFANASTGWAVGDNGTILSTVNGGATWSMQTSGTTQDLRSVQVISADSAYVVGASGIILKTVDGGSEWYEQESPTSQQINRVFFLNPDVGYAVGNNGTILNAVNQGDNWTGGGVKRSLKGVFFVSPSTGWIVGEDGVILKTTDTGSTWIEQYREEGVQLYGVFFVDANTGWASGENGLILKTTNGGTTWTPQTSNTAVTLRSIHFRNANRGFIIGGTESILETSNGGTNWASLFVGAPGARVFDRTLIYKYLKPNQSQQIILDAMESFSTPLRGYQATLDLTIGAGVDSTVVSPMSRCGHVDSIPCQP